LRNAIAQRAIGLPAAFIFIWQATPTTHSAFFYFSTNELGFEPEFLGRVHLVTSVASLVGVWLFQRFFRNIPFQAIIGWTVVLSAVLGMTPLILITHVNRTLGIDDHWFSLGDSLILTVMGKIAFMPILVLAARLCPPGVEATLFALLMSISNLGGLVSNQLGALLTHWLGVTEINFDNLWLLVVISSASRFLPLLFLGWLPAGDPQTEIEAEDSHQSLPIAEVFEHHAVGSLSEQPFLPDLIPDFMRNPVASAPIEEPVE
jgi:folate/biopterin transporter